MDFDAYNVANFEIQTSKMSTFHSGFSGFKELLHHHLGVHILESVISDGFGRPPEVFLNVS